MAGRLGLSRRPLAGPGGGNLGGPADPFALQALTEPLDVQLLAGPGQPALQFTLPLVIVVPQQDPTREAIFEFQLAAMDFCKHYRIDQYSTPWQAKLTDRRTESSYIIPAIAPRPPGDRRPLEGTSTFRLTRETYDEVRSR